MSAGLPHRPKLSDVAEVATVSEATVSRVLNGRPGVAESTRQRVLSALGELGYDEPERRRVDAGIVGIITPELDNPVFPVLAQAIETSLAPHGVISFVCSSTSETVSEADVLDQLVKLDASGVVVVSGRYADTRDGSVRPYVRLLDDGMPVVLVNAASADMVVPAIAVDEAAGAREAVRHLVTLGHRRIGLLVGPGRYASSVAKQTGWRQALDEFDVEADDHLVVETVFTVEGGHAGAAQVLEADATAVVCGSDLMALGAIRAARQWGRRVPEDFSVVGFDGTDFMRFTDPPLTTVRQPVDRMASAVAASLMLQRGGTANRRVQFFAPDLVVGGSTAPAPRPAG